MVELEEIMVDLEKIMVDLAGNLGGWQLPCNLVNTLDHNQRRPFTQSQVYMSRLMRDNREEDSLIRKAHVNRGNS